MVKILKQGAAVPANMLAAAVAIPGLYAVIISIPTRDSDDNLTREHF